MTTHVCAQERRLCSLTQGLCHAPGSQRSALCVYRVVPRNARPLDGCGSISSPKQRTFRSYILRSKASQYWALHFHALRTRSIAGLRGSRYDTIDCVPKKHRALGTAHILFYKVRAKSIAGLGVSCSDTIDCARRSIACWGPHIFDSMNCARRASQY